MPSAALKHLAKKADVSMDRAEHLWDKAKGIVDKQYGKKSKGYYALVTGITKKMMGLGEQLTEEEQVLSGVGPVENLLSKLFMARNVAHMHHWKTKSFALHLALGELYEGLTTFADDLAEIWMGFDPERTSVPLSDPNGFSEDDPVRFIGELHVLLGQVKERLPQQDYFINKYEELQAFVAKIKYKAENLR